MYCKPQTQTPLAVRITVRYILDSKTVNIPQQRCTAGLKPHCSGYLGAIREALPIPQGYI